MKKKITVVLILGVLSAFLLSMLNKWEPKQTAYASDSGIQTESAAYIIFFPIMFNAPPPPHEPPYDMARFMIGNGRLYEVWHSVNNSQARFQTQTEGVRFFHTKGNEVSAEWEELWATNDTIYRGTDTSPGNGQFYTLRDHPNQVGSAWSPRFWNVGDIYERNPLVTFYWKSNCDIVVQGYQRTWLRLEAYYHSYTFESGITLYNVVELAWLLNPNAEPTEVYLYAEHYGLVGWRSTDHGYSYISEIHAPGERPDNTPEEIACLQATLQESPVGLNSIIGPLPPPYRAK
ncbi:MAG: hypothetical protein CSA11_07700 [Chloroflexi bacterium]|nr:MAG: hypothetical protein CSA11_07700 [Chloroflexota bacterium]